MPSNLVGENSRADYGTYNDTAGNVTRINVSDVGGNVHIDTRDVPTSSDFERRYWLVEGCSRLRYLIRYIHKECLRGTRVELLRKIDEWFEDTKAPNVLFLVGGAGTGKSTVAATVAFKHRSQTGSEQYFERGRSDPKTIFRTIASDLARRDHVFADAVKPKLKGSARSTSVRRSFVQLLYDPLHNVEERKSGDDGNVLVILDALDECGDRGSREEYVRVLKDELPKLPARYRFLLTSRPECDIVSFYGKPRTYKIWIEREPGANNDILLYIKNELGHLPEIAMDSKWEENVRALCAAANGLFIWAATAIELIKERPGSMGRELKRLVAKGSLSGSLDKLYEDILGNSLYWDQNMITNFSEVFSLIFFGKGGFSGASIEKMLGIDSGGILVSLRSLIMFNPDQSDQLLTFHASLYDYLTSENTREKPWFIDERRQKEWIAHLCFDVMKKHLRFNICNLETSFKRNGDVDDLRDRIEKNIPKHLQYACRNWALHLQEAVLSDGLVHELETFTLNRFLFWIEVLSLTHVQRLSHEYLWASDQWKERQFSLGGVICWLAGKHKKLQGILQNADMQLKKFSRPILESTPHIYMTFLPFMKQSSTISELYAKRAKCDTLTIIERVDKKPPTACISLDRRNSSIYSIAYSPNGEYITSVSSDGIYAWDAVNGKPRAIVKEQKTFAYAKFSGNRKRVVLVDSQSDMIVKDAASGEVVQGKFEVPLRPHTQILCVSISPDGDYLATCSDAITRFHMSNQPYDIKLRDANSGRYLFTIRADSMVQTLVYSQDGQKIACSLWDKSIRIWDVSSRVQLFELRGHSASAGSMQFSLDDSRIVSASSEEIIVWDTRTGHVIGNPIKQGASRVCFSPNRKWIISALKDTVFLWNARSGDLLFRVCPSKPPSSICFETKKTNISSIDHFPTFDNENIEFATASKDGVIRIWSTNESLEQGTWQMDDDGWLTKGGDNLLLIWVPEDLRRSLSFGPCVCTLNTPFSTRITFTGYEGARWTECFTFPNGNGEDITLEMLPPPPKTTLLSTFLDKIRFKTLFPYLFFAITIACFSIFVSRYDLY